MNPFTIENTARNVATVRFEGVRAGWEQWVLLSSDRHHDSARCDRELEKRHLEQALEREALIIDCGDLLDGMQGKYDPRRSYADVRPEDVGVDYYDRIVQHAAAEFGPYAKNWILLAKGNHETAILDKCNTDVTSQLAYLLNNEHGGQVRIGGYGGWVRFLFRIQKTVQMSINLKYFHGAGGGGPVTCGVIQSNRQAVYLPDAHVVINGHTHDAWHVPIARERLLYSGKVARDLVHYVRIPGYKDAYGDGAEGWDVERWAAPKPLGSVWMRLFYEDAFQRDGKYGRYCINMEFVQAVR